MPPDWLETLAVISLALAGVCALAIIVDIHGCGYRQRMGVTAWVGPITAHESIRIGCASEWRRPIVVAAAHSATCARKR